MLSIVNSRHPLHISNFYNWLKWRLTYEGGDIFINKYLERFSSREDHIDFQKRKNITYCPAFAKAAINDIKNSIFQRLVDVTRTGGPTSYEEATLGLNGGVDKTGSSMNCFLGLDIIIELLIMSRVGIYIDMPRLPGPTLIDKGNAHPYLYMYRTEQIKSWAYNPEEPESLLAVLLEEDQYVTNDYGLVTREITNYRYMSIDPSDGRVICQFFNQSGSQITDTIKLSLSRIPLVILEISNSLMSDAANYQIALLNLESSDLLYILRSNFPFYTEQFNPAVISPYVKTAGREVTSVVQSDVNIVSAVEKTEEVAVGVTAGRRYPIGTERPGFIAPPEGPLKISMEKEEQLKRDIRLLINLSVQNLQPRRSSAESKIADERSLVNGLSYIGLELERAEQQVAWFWSQYEGTNNVATVKYPENYELSSKEDRKLEIDNLKELISKVPSRTFRKEGLKRIVELTVSNRVSIGVLDKIYSEIDGSLAIDSDPKNITMDLENGLLGLELASKIRGYPAGEVEKAKEDHAERLERIAAAQTPGMGYGARGVSDLSTNPKEGKEEKQLAREDGKAAVPTDKGRGEAG